MRRIAAGGWVIVLAVGWGRVRADDFRVIDDPAGDAVVRKTDAGGAGRVRPESHRLPDITRITIGTWQPDAPDVDPYVGRWDQHADEPFLRVDIEFDGLVNPPGLLDFDGGGFNPFRFGPHPVFGFVEFDVDRNIDTGGETQFPQYRFLGSAGRFGGLPADVRPRLIERFAQEDSAFDGRCSTKPRVEFSGEEFHIAFLGSEYGGHRELRSEGGDPNTFEAGEVWLLEDGTWFHRAHGYKEFSFACGTCGGLRVGTYMPRGDLLWSHDRDVDRTTVTLVFPLTQRAANAMAGYPGEEPLDGDPRNQASVHEALTDLLFSARVWRDRPRQDCVDIILDWAQTDPQDQLRPDRWGVNALLSTSYVRKTTAFFVWTDLSPDAAPGDFDGDGAVTPSDYVPLYRYVRARDGGPDDDDGRVNGRVVVPRFAANFSLFDIDDDGTVGGDDAARINAPGDLDGDRDIDLADYARFVVCYTGPREPDEPLEAECVIADSDFDGDVDLLDFRSLQNVFTGADP